MTAVITVYSTENCPKCRQLKDALNEIGVEFNEMNMVSAGAVTELRIGGVFTLTAPVLKVEDEYYAGADLFGEDQFGIPGMVLMPGILDRAAQGVSRASDKERLDFLLKYFSIIDVGDEHAVSAVSILFEDLEQRLGCGMDWDADMRDVIDKAMKEEV